MLRFFLLFLLFQSVLFSLELMQPVRAAFVIPYTEWIAHVSAWAVQLFDSNVTSHGIIIRSTTNGFAVSIQAGCNGLEAIIILVSAMLAFSAPWRAKLVGIILGSATILVLNFARIISLFYLGQWNLDVFEWAHLYLWQVLIMLDVLVVFLIWIQRLPPPSTATKEAAA